MRRKKEKTENDVSASPSNTCSAHQHRHFLSFAIVNTDKTSDQHQSINFYHIRQISERTRLFDALEFTFKRVLKQIIIIFFSLSGLANFVFPLRYMHVQKFLNESQLVPMMLLSVCDTLKFYCIITHNFIHRQNRLGKKEKDRERRKKYPEK